MPKVLLTGKPGTGKTTLIKKVIKELKRETGGFYTEEIRERDKRVGFKIKSLSGEEGILAHINVRSEFRVGKYGVNIGDLERVGLLAIKEAMEDDKLIVMDEIGRMELYSKKFQEQVLSCLESNRSLLGTIQDRHNEFLDKIRKREDVTIIRVTPKNRSLLLPQIIRLFKEEL